MDPNSRLLMLGAGGIAPEQEAIYADDVMDARTYTGNSSTQQIINGIDLATEGGLVWLKGISGISGAMGYHFLVDTIRGGASMLWTNDSQNAISTSPPIISSFNSDGFTLSTGSGLQNVSGVGYLAWTFRRAPKFFDMVSYVGDGASQRSISHSLGSVPGFIIVKCTNTSGTNWICYHRSVTNGWMRLDSTAGVQTRTDYIYQNPTSSTFDVGFAANTNGDTYIAYLFAHNAGGFGAAGTDSIVKCDSFSGNGSSQFINLGFEPKYVIIKATSSTSSWACYDTGRGIASPGTDNYIALQNTTGQLFYDDIDISSTGFTVKANGSAVINQTGVSYLYIAIAKNPERPPDGTDLFAAVARAGTGASATVTTGFQPNMAISINRGSTEFGPVVDSNRGVTRYLSIAQAPLAAESTNYSGEWFTSFTATGATLGADNSGGKGVNASGNNYIHYYFKEYPGFFDVTTYSGSNYNTGSYYNVAHSLGVTPELIIVKCRGDASPGAGGWHVLHAPTNKEFLYWSSSSSGGNPSFLVTTGLSSSTFRARDHYNTNYAGLTYVAYLFATLPGVSKVGSYTGTGADINVDCGFTTGARFAMIKRSDGTGQWYVWDSARGIVSGNDPYWRPSTPGAEVTTNDYIDPLASGFTVTSAAPAELNAAGGTYIYLAIA